MAGHQQEFWIRFNVQAIDLVKAKGDLDLDMILEGKRTLTVGAAVSRLEAPAVAPAGNPSCCSACKGSTFIRHLFTIASI